MASIHARDFYIMVYQFSSLFSLANSEERIAENGVDPSPQF